MKAANTHLDALRWGLVPQWAMDLAIGNRLINARAETVAERPAFRDAFARGWRCLVPADGFYRWRAEAGQKAPKQPYAVVLAGGGVARPGRRGGADLRHRHHHGG